MFTPRNNWAPVRFLQPRVIRVPEATRASCERIYRLQEEDSVRFAVASSGLLERLDLAGGVLTVMTCDERFALLFENWSASCDHAGIDTRHSTIVFTSDRAAFDRVTALGYVAWFDDESILLRDMGSSLAYSDERWVDYMFHQNWVIEQVLGLDVDVLFQDVDVVWHADPRPTLRDGARSGAHIQAMYDGPNSRFQPLYANSGFMYFRNGRVVREFWREVYERHDMVATYRSQQEPLGVLLSVHAQRGLSVSILDEGRFANGHLLVSHREPPADPWVVHISWTANLEAKLHRYLERGLWFLDDDVAHRALAAESP